MGVWNWTFPEPKFIFFQSCILLKNCSNCLFWLSTCSHHPKDFLLGAILTVFSHLRHLLLSKSHHYLLHWSSWYPYRTKFLFSNFFFPSEFSLFIEYSTIRWNFLKFWLLFQFLILNLWTFHLFVLFDYWNGKMSWIMIATVSSTQKFHYDYKFGMD